MRVEVNGARRDLAEGTTVAELLGERLDGVAVAVNDDVVPRSRWGIARVQEGDRVEILEPRQGG
ncbi:MAG: sulfur carrier protein ThiS [Acidimicrobiia bacterium]|nr:sulfur carrier protein ThiS [Acidimicrobiia bacterium]